MGHTDIFNESCEMNNLLTIVTSLHRDMTKSFIESVIINYIWTNLNLRRMYRLLNDLKIGFQ